MSCSDDSIKILENKLRELKERRSMAYMSLSWYDKIKHQTEVVEDLIEEFKRSINND